MSNLIEALEAERERIDNAIAALRSGGIGHKQRGPRHLNAEARRKISLAQKRRWREQKKSAQTAA